MSLPGNAPSSTLQSAPFLEPYDRPKLPLEDFEYGGIALNDGTQGLNIQVWHLTYDADEASDNYGDFTLVPELYGLPSVVLNVPDVISVCLAFNQNMDVFIGYEKRNGVSEYYWYDTATASYKISTLPAGAYSPQACLDDHRQTQTNSSDIILGYMRSGSLYYRQQRDRFTIERELGNGAGAARLRRVGMTTNSRLKFDVRFGSGSTLCEIVGDLCKEVGISGAKLELKELCETEVRGYMISGLYSSAEAIRGLIRTYFFDMPEYDGKLWGLLRGRPVVAVIRRSDFVLGDEPVFESVREQEVEFAGKVHLAFACAESDYTPTKATSERTSSSVKTKSELTIETFVNLEPTEAADRVNTMHKQAFAELAGKIEFGVGEHFSYLIPSDVALVEVKENLFKRFRIDDREFIQGVYRFKAGIDRASVYGNPVIHAPTIPTPTPPPANLPGVTTWYPLDLPALQTAHDSEGLLYYLAGYGDSEAWTGAQVQREVASEYQTEAEINYRETMGLLDTALPYASSLIPDTTNSFDVTTNKDLYSISDEQLYIGKNACVVGDEIIQFRDVESIGVNQWRLTHLLRGRLDTLAVAHSDGERFVFLGKPVRVSAETSLIGQTFNLRAPSFGTVPTAATPQPFSFTGESQREWAPAGFTAAQDGNAWQFNWVPRYRLGDSANPVKSIHQNGYRIKFTIGSTTVVKDVAAPSYTYPESEQFTDFGSAQSSFDSVDVMALNSLTGEGRSLSQAVT